MKMKRRILTTTATEEEARGWGRRGGVGGGGLERKGASNVFKGESGDLRKKVGMEK